MHRQGIALGRSPGAILQLIAPAGAAPQGHQEANLPQRQQLKEPIGAGPGHHPIRRRQHIPVTLIEVGKLPISRPLKGGLFLSSTAQVNDVIARRQGP